MWNAAPAAAPTPAPVAASAPVAAPAAQAHAESPGRLAQMWDGAKGMGSRAYHGLSSWNFEGRDAHNGKAPTQQEINQDPAWRLMGAKESIYHNNPVTTWPVGLCGLGICAGL